MASEGVGLIEVVGFRTDESKTVFVVQFGSEQYTLDKQYTTFEAHKGHGVCIFTMPLWYVLELGLQDFVIGN